MVLGWGLGPSQSQEVCEFLDGQGVQAEAEKAGKQDSCYPEGGRAEASKLGSATVSA